MDLTAWIVFLYAITFTLSQKIELCRKKAGAFLIYNYYISRLIKSFNINKLTINKGKKN
jgi:hypothetical protein